MPKKVPPPLSLTLLWLRNRVAWTQTELADAAGVHNNVLCDLEHGVRDLDRDQLNGLAALMGFGPGDVELVHLTLLAVPEPGRASSPAAGPARSPRTSFASPGRPPPPSASRPSRSPRPSWWTTR
jgi:transcriptional regulator with XRE-family HTH domain